MSWTPLAYVLLAGIVLWGVWRLRQQSKPHTSDVPSPEEVDRTLKKGDVAHAVQKYQALHQVPRDVAEREVKKKREEMPRITETLEARR